MCLFLSKQIYIHPYFIKMLDQNHQDVVINPNKAAAQTYILVQVLQTTSEELAPMLIHLFQQSLKHGTITFKLETCMHCLYSLKGNRTDPKNYHPVSLKSCTSMEHILSCTTLTITTSYSILYYSLASTLTIHVEHNCFLTYHFLANFDPSNSCTLHFLCPCSRCQSNSTPQL